MIAAVTSLLFDLNLKSYWFARGLTVALAVLFGVILKEFGYETTTILLSWCALYLAKGLSFLSIDALSPARQSRLAALGCYLAIACAGVMMSQGMTVWMLSALIVLLQPAIREAIHDGTVYVRERQDWPLGVDVASALSNEVGKSLGAVLIGVVGVLMALGSNWLMLGLIAFSLIIIWGHRKPALPDSLTTSTEAALQHPRIDATAKAYLSMSFIHNGVFFAIQGFLSLALYDLLKAGGFGSDTIGTLGVLLTVVMILGLMAYSWFRKRAGQLPGGNGKSPMLAFSVGSLALLSTACFVVIGLWQADVIGPATTALMIGSLMGLLMAFGGFYTLGTLQLLDAIYRYAPETDRNAGRKRVLHLNMMVCQFSPAVVLLAIYGASQHYENLAALSYSVTGLIAAIEGVMVLCCLNLSRSAQRYPMEQNYKASMG